MTTDERVFVFGLPGTPMGKPSVRGKNFTIRSNKKINLYRARLTGEVKSAADTLIAAGVDLSWLNGALDVEVRFTFRPPNSRMHRVGHRHTIKPDRDNLEKLLYDAMEDAGVLPLGDQSITGGEVVKVWGHVAGVFVTVRPSPSQEARREPVGASLGGG